MIPVPNIFPPSCIFVSCCLLTGVRQVGVYRQLRLEKSHGKVLFCMCLEFKLELLVGELLIASFGLATGSRRLRH